MRFLISLAAETAALPGKPGVLEGKFPEKFVEELFSVYFGDLVMAPSQVMRHLPCEATIVISFEWMQKAALIDKSLR